MLSLFNHMMSEAKNSSLFHVSLIAGRFSALKFYGLKKKKKKRSERGAAVCNVSLQYCSFAHYHNSLVNVITSILHQHRRSQWELSFPAVNQIVECVAGLRMEKINKTLSCTRHRRGTTMKSHISIFDFILEGNYF